MKINDSSTTTDSLYHYTLFLLGLESTDTTSFPVADFMRSANASFRRLVFLMWRNTSDWEFDDKNYATLPIATTNLVANQKDYTLPTEALDVQRVEAKDSSGKFVLLRQIDKEKIKDSLTEYQKTGGIPNEYDVFGNSISIYPVSSSSQTAGLKLYLSRDISEFASTDTTKEPGIQETLHPYLAYGSALDYAISKNMDKEKVRKLQDEVNKYELEISDYAAKRNRGTKPNIRPKTINSI